MLRLSRGHERAGHEPDETGLDAMIVLAAFNGAAFGVVGSLAAALASDTTLSLFAGLGALVCACVWKSHLIDGNALVDE